MKLEQYWSTHYEYTGITSSAIRTLVLSGIGAVWLFKTDAPSGNYYLLPTPAILALLAFSFAVIADLLQYAILGERYRRHARAAERAGQKQEEDLGDHPDSYNTAGYVCYWLKFSLTLFGYVCLATYLAGRIAFA